MSVNFHQEIKELKEKLKKSEDTLVAFKTSYRKMQDRIDLQHKLMYAEKEQISLLIYSINEILDNLDSGINKIDVNNLKILKNVESLMLINTVLNQIKDIIAKKMVDLKKMSAL
ncbi:MAG: hypothetical protein ACFFHV_03615 [Promethearchaeota archaeon]